MSGLRSSRLKASQTVARRKGTPRADIPQQSRIGPLDPSQTQSGWSSARTGIRQLDPRFGQSLVHSRYGQSNNHEGQQIKCVL